MKFEELVAALTSVGANNENEPNFALFENELIEENEPEEIKSPQEIYDELMKAISIPSLSLVEEIIQKENGEISNIVNITDSRGYSLLFIAAEKRDPEIMRILLQSESDPNAIDLKGRTPLHVIVDGGCKCEKCSTKAEKCLEVLIEFGASIDPMDSARETPLHYATKNMLAKCAKALLDYGADVNIKSGGKNLGYLIVQKIPEALIQVLDKGILYDETDNSKLKLDFGIILQSSPEDMTNSDLLTSMTKHETSLMSFMLKSHRRGREGLLNHPLSQAFVFLKWKSIRIYFWIIQLFYLILTTLYTVYVFRLFIDDCPWEAVLENKCEVNTYTEIMAIVVSIFVVIMILNEAYELFVNKMEYFNIRINYLWWLLIGFATSSIIPGLGSKPRQWQYPMAGYGIFLAWSLNLVQISRIPYFGVYVEMLGKVLKDFAIYCFAYSSVFIAFALGFRIMFPQDELFKSIPLSFVQTLILMIGEPNYEGLFENGENLQKDDLAYSIPVHIFYVGFLLVTSIVLMNLLLGLAVSDIQELLKHSTLSRVTRQIQQINLLETLIHSKLLPRVIAKRLKRHFSILRYVDGRYFRFSPLDPEDNTLPTDLKQQFIPFLTTNPCIRKKNLKNLLNAQMHGKTLKAISAFSNNNNNEEIEDGNKGTFGKKQPQDQNKNKNKKDKVKVKIALQKQMSVFNSLAESINQINKKMDDLSKKIERLELPI